MTAGPFVPVEGRVNWQERLEQDVQAGCTQHLQNHGGPLEDQNHGGFIAPQQFMGQQERYAEEEHLHRAHLHDIQL